MIEGISHLTFVVKDLGRASRFFKEIFDAEEIYTGEGDSIREKFFLVGGQWVVISEGDSLPERTYNHTAFKIGEEDFALYENKIRGLNLEMGPSRVREKGEGRSLYFYDFDNHLFELHTGTLLERLSHYAQNSATKERKG